MGHSWGHLAQRLLLDGIMQFHGFFHKDLLRISSSVRTVGNDLTRGNYPQISGDLPLLWFKQ